MSNGIHGTSAVAQETTWTVEKYGYGATVRPSTSSTQNWVHFAVPTPRGYDVTKVEVQFATGNHAHIIGVDVWDGGNRIESISNLNLGGSTAQVGSWSIPGGPKLVWGVGISLAIKFDAGPGDQGAWITFYSAGVYYQEQIT
jgi:hypothetical protein